MKTIKNKAHTIKNTVSSVLDFMKLTLTIVLNITKNKEEMRDTIAYGAIDGKIQSAKKNTNDIPADRKASLT